MFDGWLLAALKHAKMSQVELSRRLAEKGIAADKSIVNKITKGRRPLSARELYAIAAITGYSPPPFERGPAPVTDGEQTVTMSELERVKLILARFVEEAADLEGALELIEFLDKGARTPQGDSVEPPDMQEMLRQAETVGRLARESLAKKKRKSAS